ncbi:MAG TPA: RES family NAD+ phosphorylase [Alphaproteobacteria bacterium]
MTSLKPRRTVRLIPTGRLKDPVLQPLASSAQGLEALAQLEGVTNERLTAQHTGLPDLHPRELVFGRAGHTLINAAFTHVRPGGSRFNDENRGAWYSAFETRTAIAEVAYHLTRELQAIGRFENVTDYTELFADFSGPFHDLRGGQHTGMRYLAADISVGYPAGQALARELQTKEVSNGVIYPSVRRQNGVCLAVFRPGLVQNVQQGGIWRLEWHGHPKPRVTRIDMASDAAQA